MIKKLILLVLFSSFIFITEVHAYTKEDILNLTKEVNICDSETKSLFQGVEASYTRLLNTRNISQNNLDLIYNNIKKVINILNKNSLCNMNDEGKLSKKLKDELYNLFEETNNIILSSPTINQSSESPNSGTTNEVIKEETKVETNIITDSTTNEIKIYEDGVLTNVIKLESKLNYVGLNKIVIITISLIIISLIISIILKFLFKKNILINSILYILILLLPISLIFKNEISKVLDYISLMKLEEKDNHKDLVYENEKIIAYPSYENKYGVIKINNEEEDLYFGDNEKTLKKGVGQANSSHLPGEGKKTILSGHNTGVFKELSNLKKKDTILIETMYGSFEYVVKKIEIVEDTNTDILDNNYDLIMYTCYPNKSLYGNKRIVVMAELVESVWLNENSEE